MSKKRPSHSGGFTLLEIMVSLAIIGGLLVTLIYSLNYNLGIAERHEFITIGSMLAKSKLTELETNPASAKGNFPEPYASYEFSAEVKQYPLPGISEVSVTVSRGKDEVKFSDLIGSKK
ncbi:MAG: type II secretion system protein [Nitrospirae bacterium]|nr:type II secretion system protein [Nitrospirota bacterium]